MRTARRREASRGRTRHVSPVDLLLLAVLIAAAFYAARPVATDLIATARAGEVISSMSSTVDRTDDISRKAVLAQAQAYNSSLAPDGGHADNEGMAGCNGGHKDVLTLAEGQDGAEVAAYDEQLRWDDQAAICWIEIPSIALREPVYHGTSDETLAIGVGHLSWSSLPVGGSSSHCVLAAHSGMEESRMFDELDRLGRGDVFVLHTLADAYQYEVFQTETVLPGDAQRSCRIEAGKDLCTLVTCTPYGINTHRLLVHAYRVPYTPEASQETSATAIDPAAMLEDRRAAPVAWLGLGAFGLACVWVVRETVRVTMHMARRLYRGLYGILLGKEARH